MRKNSVGIMALFAVGGYFVWKNRFQIRRFLEAQGLDLPIDTSNLKETISSSAAKVLGKFDRSNEGLEKIENEATRQAG